MGCSSSVALPATLRRWIEQTPGWRFGVGLGIGAYLVARIPPDALDSGPTFWLLLLAIAVSVIGAAIPGSGLVLAGVVLYSLRNLPDWIRTVPELPIAALKLVLVVLAALLPLCLALIAVHDDVRRWRERPPLWPRLPFALGGDRPPRPGRPDWESGLVFGIAFYTVVTCVSIVLDSFALYDFHRALPNSALLFGGLTVAAACLALSSILPVQRWVWAPWLVLCALAGELVVWRLVFTQEHLDYRIMNLFLGSQTSWESAAFWLRNALMAMICVREILRIDPGGLVAAFRKVL